MNIKSKLLLASGAMLVSATMAFGAITSDQLVAQFQADGYSFITVKTGLTQIKVEAVKGSTLYETVYDIATGTVIDTDTYAIGAINRPNTGVITRTVNRDFEDDYSGADNDDIVGGDLDDDISDDDGADHDLFDDHGSDDDSDDDHSRSSGSDDDHSHSSDSDDDHGGDDGDDD